MFIYMVAFYGTVIMLMGLLGGEPELVIVGFLMVLVGDLHVLGGLIKRWRQHKGQMAKSRHYSVDP